MGMNMTGTKLALGAAASLGMIDIGEITQLKELGMVGLLMVGLYYLYRDGKAQQAMIAKSNERLAAVIELNTSQRATETEVLRGLKDEIEKCHNKRIKEQQ